MINIDPNSTYKGVKMKRLSKEHILAIEATDNSEQRDFAYLFDGMGERRYAVFSTHARQQMLSFPDSKAMMLDVFYKNVSNEISILDALSDVKGHTPKVLSRLKLITDALNEDDCCYEQMYNLFIKNIAEYGVAEEAIKTVIANGRSANIKLLRKAAYESLFKVLYKGRYNTMSKVYLEACF